MECKHGLRIGCASCAARKQTPVFVSGRGDVYHARERCQALIEGKQKADAALFNIHPVSRVSRLEALTMGRRPCDWCCTPAFFRAS